MVLLLMNGLTNSNAHNTKTMKKLFILLGLLSLSFAFVACSDDDDDAIVSLKDLPASANQFLSDHFSGTTDENARVTKDNDSYDVILNAGYKIEFNLDGTWDSVDGEIGNKMNALPESFLMLDPVSKMRDYVNANYSESVFIVEVDKEHDKQGNLTGYDVDLSDNSPDIRFDKNGDKI